MPSSEEEEAPYTEDVENPVAALPLADQKAFMKAASRLIDLIREHDLPWYQAVVKFGDGERFILDWRSEKEWAAGGRMLRKAVDPGGADVV